MKYKIGKRSLLKHLYVSRSLLGGDTSIHLYKKPLLSQLGNLPKIQGENTKISFVPGSKVSILGMVIPPSIGNRYNGYINPAIGLTQAWGFHPPQHQNLKKKSVSQDFAKANSLFSYSKNTITNQHLNLHPKHDHKSTSQFSLFPKKIT